MHFYCAVALVSLPLCQYKNLVIEMLIWHWCDCHFLRALIGSIIILHRCLAELFTAFMNKDQLSQLKQRKENIMLIMYMLIGEEYEW